MGVYESGIYESGVYESGVYKSGSEDTVTIGGRTYKTVKIGDQVWLAENLDFVFDGLVVGEDTSTEEPRANYFNNDERTYGWNGAKYGLLYNWISVAYLESHKSELLPAGWRVPVDNDWKLLIYTLGYTNVGTKLKSTTGWTSGNGDGSTAFSAFPAGYFTAAGNFLNIGSFAYFWTNLEADSSTDAYYRYLSANSSSLGSYSRSKAVGNSVRLVKDTPAALLGGPLLGSSNTEATDGE